MNKSVLDREKIINIIFDIIIVFELCAVAAFIFACTKKYFQSDMASAILLAEQEKAQLKLIPDNFIHSTGIMIFNINLLIVPLLGLFKNLILCREIAVFMAIVIFTVVFMLVFKNKNNRYEAVSKRAGIMLALLPVSYWVTFEYFYEAVYLSGAIKMLIIVYLVKKISEQKSKKSGYIFFGIYLIAILLFNIDSLRNYIFMVIPLVLAFIIVALINESGNIVCALKNKKYMLISVTTFISGTVGIFIYKLLAGNVLSESADSIAMYVKSDELAGKIGAVINNIFDLYGATGECYLMSLTALLKCICFVYMLFMVIVFPVIAVKKYNKLDAYKKIITVFVFCSNFVVLYTQIFTSLCETRYLLQLYINNIILMVIVLPYLLEDIKQKELKYIFYMCVIMFVAVVQGKYFMSETVNAIREEKEGSIKASENALIDFLKQKELTYGFATYWNAYGNMVLSDNEVMILAYKEEPLTPYYWMTNKEWYDIDKHEGRCFILLSEGEEIDDIYYEEADEEYVVEDYRILVYNENIYTNNHIKNKIKENIAQ